MNKIAVILLIVVFAYCEGYVRMPWGGFLGQKVPSLCMSTQVEASVDFGLTPVLKEYAEAFRGVVDDKYRYQQLLYLAMKAKPMDASLRVDANKVPGCLSTVHVYATMDEEGRIFFEGDSDSQLTKGLVTMLVNGLSGSTIDTILQVKAEFIQYAGIAKSLTPGRNNGFLNMLSLMKAKAKALAEQRGMLSSSAQMAQPVPVQTLPEPAAASDRPIFSSIQKKLSMLKPVLLVVEDESHKHAGHSGMNGAKGTETHFNVKISAACFEGLPLVQRHKMVYSLLAAEMKNGIHALSIVAKAPSEA